MRWKIKKTPSLGDTRIKERFLIFPKEIKGEIRWLEHAKYMQQYTEICMFDGEGPITYREWDDIKWVDY